MWTDKIKHFTNCGWIHKEVVHINKVERDTYTNEVSLIKKLTKVYYYQLDVYYG